VCLRPDFSGQDVRQKAVHLITQSPPEGSLFFSFVASKDVLAKIKETDQPDDWRLWRGTWR
jgi:hypothetical protein